MRRWLAAGVVIAALGVSATAGTATLRNGPGQYAPRDECVGLPGAAAFRAALRRAVTRRDVNALALLSAPNIRLDFGGGAGREELKRRLRGSEGAALWRELDQIMALGCAVQDGGMAMPWFFGQDLGDLDAYDIWLVAGSSVPLYEVPDSKGRVLRRLSWQLVDPPGGVRDGDPFQQVDVAGMRLRGFVETARLRSQIDYRLIARRKGRSWQIDAFIAGD